MQQIQPLTYGKFYHIYNRGINGCNLFEGKDNYEYFLNLYDKHVSPVVDTFAWVLMKNHFHLLVRIKEEAEISDLTGFKNLSGLGLEHTSKPPHQYFSNLFNAYTKAFNKMYGRHGNLFERPFKRKQIEDKDYFKNLVIYIHNNPVHHGFTEYAMDYPWSSYLTCISIKPTHLQRDAVIGWFDNAANFKTAHDNYSGDEEMEKWLGL
jgi:REP element-mobilizing transposase RayT